MRRQRLIEARKAIGKTQEEVAEAVGVDRTTLGKWERDESTPQPGQRSRYAEALGITLDELAAMLSSVPSIEAETPDWVSTYLGMEQSATSIRAHEPRGVYGLLQTPRYTAALISRVGITGVSDTYIQRSIEQRLYRQKRVRSGDLEIDLVQPESALHLVVGTPEVMAEQMASCLELAELPTVTLRVSPYSAGNHEALRLGNFALMTHPWGTPRVHLEGYGGGRFITNADEVSYFSAVFDQAKSMALTPVESKKFVQRLEKAWSKKC
ncbi:helix-turn-helix transcriptional regulator [Nocardia sp. NPDC050799]|uniref:helix-turn-helix domain-containing protein n=1 Tax=Nocardia sp. NPDC050799 TaxID=3154842 RepID=UPI00340197CC